MDIDGARTAIMPHFLEIALPLAVVEASPGSPWRVLGPIQGTGIPLAGRLVATANHVAKALFEAGGSEHRCAVALLPVDGEQRARIVRMQQWASFPEIDVAILQASPGDSFRTEGESLVKLASGSLPLGTDIMSVGFPHVTPDAFRPRMLRGHVVSTCINVNDDFPAVPNGVRLIETSYRCPKGMSGAAVVAGDAELRGIIIGERQTRTDVIESENDGGTEYIYRQYAAYGIAVSLQEVLARQVGDRNLRSILLDLGMELKE